jgi:hypothetical protein
MIKMIKKINLSSLVIGLVFASLFSISFYVVGITTNYLPIKLPAALSFLISNEGSSIGNADGAMFDDEVIDNTPVENADKASINYSFKLVQ